MVKGPQLGEDLDPSLMTEVFDMRAKDPMPCVVEADGNKSNSSVSIGNPASSTLQLFDALRLDKNRMKKIFESVIMISKLSHSCGITQDPLEVRKAWR